MIDVAIGFKPFVARAHTMQGDQDHRQVIGETKRKFRAPPSRPGDGSIESLSRRAVLVRRDSARRRRAHELLRCASCIFIARSRLESDVDRPAKTRLPALYRRRRISFDLAQI